MSKLYSPGIIGNVVIRNRFIMTPLHLAYCPGGEVTDRLVEFYRLRARGGVGLIVVGAVGIDPWRVNQHNMIQMYDDCFIQGLRRLTDAVHAEGAKVFPQLWHGGRYQRPREYSGQQPVAPSPVYSRFSGETPRELNHQEINDIIAFFAAAARRAQEANFDGVEIAGSAGYLISQFLSSTTNLRKDKYGGDLQGRMTFALEVIAAIREATGPDFPIMFRVAGNDFIDGSNTNAEARQICVALERAGVDAINVTGGWHETHVPQISMEVPPGAFSYLCREIKEVVSIPVIACNRIHVQMAEKLVDNGDADFIGIARGFVADPELVNKAKIGQYAAIRPCIACNQGCMDSIFYGKSLSCLSNAEAGREAELLEEGLLPTEVKSTLAEKVLVIGAGVAGLEYARVAASRGHQVAIWEADKEPGGQMLLAAAPPGRHDIHRLRDYLLAACLGLKVQIYCNKVATADDVIAAVNSGIFERVVVASGASPSVIPFPVEKGAVVIQARDVLNNKTKTGSKIVIVGGGATGVETALLLAQDGTLDAQTLRYLLLHQAETPEELYRLLTHGRKQITIVEMAKGIGKDIGPSTRWSMIEALRKLSVTMVEQGKVVAIEHGGVVIEKANRQDIIPADTVVVALGSSPDTNLLTELTGKADKVSVIGDAYKPGNMLTAIRQAYDEAIKML
ncbi:FAD-dependent oxidoreductase [Sporomusa malonica]|uniref:2,4-dienoyl-CoA reductase (NADPH2) n=1 Tax=Sporomusa malonica TaxID=112901 RepID=A0A1W2E779_9FIRM|nr:FAD-dependent oxidoreductase [Sporomusa malonica]SMD05515.1 2,4-dienoyl-CoA reductase (NADPH2) [Sporomusa malonica]